MRLYPAVICSPIGTSKTPITLEVHWAGQKLGKDKLLRDPGGAPRLDLSEHGDRHLRLDPNSV